MHSFQFFFVHSMDEKSLRFIIIYLLYNQKVRNSKGNENWTLWIQWLRLINNFKHFQLNFEIIIDVYGGSLQINSNFNHLIGAEKKKTVCSVCIGFEIDFSQYLWYEIEFRVCSSFLRWFAALQFSKFENWTIILDPFISTNSNLKFIIFYHYYMCNVQT